MKRASLPLLEFSTLFVVVIGCVMAVVPGADNYVLQMFSGFSQRFSHHNVDLIAAVGPVYKGPTDQLAAGYPERFASRQSIRVEGDLQLKDAETEFDQLASRLPEFVMDSDLQRSLAPAMDIEAAETEAAETEAAETAISSDLEESWEQDLAISFEEGDSAEAEDEISLEPTEQDDTVAVAAERLPASSVLEVPAYIEPIAESIVEPTAESIIEPIVEPIANDQSLAVQQQVKTPASVASENWIANPLFTARESVGALIIKNDLVEAPEGARIAEQVESTGEILKNRYVTESPDQLPPSASKGASTQTSEKSDWRIDEMPAHPVDSKIQVSPRLDVRSSDVSDGRGNVRRPMSAASMRENNSFRIRHR